MPVKVEKITECVTLGEGPHWDERQQALFFVGIHDKTIHKYVPATKEYTKTIVDGHPGFIVSVQGTTDQFIVGLGQRFVIIQWDGKNGSPAKVVKVVGEVNQGISNAMINDGKADPRGRIYAGTFGTKDHATVEPGKGSLYRVDKGIVTKLDTGISLSNGLAWDLKEKAFYYTDSAENKIRRYDYDVETGDISNKSYIFDLKKNNIEGSPDGFTIDENGNLWVAVFYAGVVINIDPRTGKLLQKISVPAEQVTSVTFGGSNLDILFATSGRLELEGKQPPPPPSGATFMVTGLGIKGLPNVHYKM